MVAILQNPERPSFEHLIQPPDFLDLLFHKQQLCMRKPIKTHTSAIFEWGVNEPTAPITKIREETDEKAIQS